MIDEPIPKVISESVAEIMGKKLHCYVLDDGNRVFDADDVRAFFDIPDEEILDEALPK